MNKMGIYIPSLSRSQRQKTLQSLPEEWQQNAYLVVSPEEEPEYRRRNPAANIITVNTKGISATRQAIMEVAKHDYVMMLDDDMGFNIRREEGLRVANTEEIAAMIGLLYRWLDKDGLVHVGISARQGNNHVTESYTEITRMNNAYAFNKERFHALGIRFDRLQIMEDFDVTLSLLEAGCPNRVTYQYAWGQGASGEGGGCSTYRDDAMQEAAAWGLQSLHPYSVKVVKKISKEAWGGFKSNVRWDVNIDWKKAYRPKTVQGKLGGFF